MSSDPKLFTQVEAIIAEQIRPMLQMDGGNITLHEVTKTGIVKVTLEGACVGCPMSQLTLQHGVEEVLKEHLPKIKKVVAV